MEVKKKKDLCICVNYRKQREREREKVEMTKEATEANDRCRNYILLHLSFHSPVFFFPSPLSLHISVFLFPVSHLSRHFIISRTAGD